MEKHKKKVLIIISIILIFISLVVIILSLLFKDENDNKPSTNPNNPNKKIISKEIKELRDEDLFFAVNNTINNYYSMLANKDTTNLLKILDDNYLLEKQINSNNIYNIINSEYETVNYIAKSIYYNPDSSITYYFINGYLTNVSMMEDNYQYYDNVNFIIVVDESNRYYNIRPLNNDINISEFAKNYKIEEKEITSKMLLSNYTMSEKNKLTTYLTEFLDLMVYDNLRAYNMLDDNTKKKYGSSERFKNELMNIYNNFSTIIFGYSSKEINGEKIYNIIDDKQTKITIYEKNIMDYKIGF